MTFTDRVLDALGPTLAERGGDVLESLVVGLTEELEATDDLVAPGREGYAKVYDLDSTPQPGWLGLATGTRVPPGLTVEQQRAYVRDQAAWRRGTLDALAAAVGAVLGGGRRVGFRERHDGHEWRIGLVVYEPDADGVTEDQIRGAAASQKAVGLVIDNVEVIPAVTYEDLTEIYPTYGDLEDAWPAYPVAPERDLDGIRWWKPADETLRYVRTGVLAPTYADRSAMFATYRDARDHDPSEELS